MTALTPGGTLHAGYIEDPNNPVYILIYIIVGIRHLPSSPFHWVVTDGEKWQEARLEVPDWGHPDIATLTPIDTNHDWSPDPIQIKQAIKNYLNGTR